MSEQTSTEEIDESRQEYADELDGALDNAAAEAFYRGMYDYAMRKIVNLEAKLRNHEATIVLLQDCLREAYEGAEDD